jgi:hypothetical protein
MTGPRKKKLRLAIKEVAFASSGRVLRGEAISNLVLVLHERPVYLIPKFKILALLNFHECETAKPI